MCCDVVRFADEAWFEPILAELCRTGHVGEAMSLLHSIFTRCGIKHGAIQHKLATPVVIGCLLAGAVSIGDAKACDGLLWGGKHVSHWGR